MAGRQAGRQAGSFLQYIKGAGIPVDTLHTVLGIHIVHTSVQHIDCFASPRFFFPFSHFPFSLFPCPFLLGLIFCYSIRYTVVFFKIEIRIYCLNRDMYRDMYREMYRDMYRRTRFGILVV